MKTRTIEEVRGIVERIVKTALTEDRFNILMNTIGNTPCFNLYNQLYIYNLRPDATHVESERSWTKFGYVVKKQANPIEILVDNEKLVYVDKDGNRISISSFSKSHIDQALKDGTIFKHKFVTNYVVGYVLDITDTVKIKGESDIEIPNRKDKRAIEIELKIWQQMLYRGSVEGDIVKSIVRKFIDEEINLKNTLLLKVITQYDLEFIIDTVAHVVYTAFEMNTKYNIDINQWFLRDQNIDRVIRCLRFISLFSRLIIMSVYSKIGYNKYLTSDKSEAKKMLVGDLILAALADDLRVKIDGSSLG